MRYSVHMRQDWVYDVDADSPEEADRMVVEGDGGRGECTGYSIETVTTPDDPFGDTDLRAPIPCRGGCGTPLPATQEWCRPCLLKPRPPVAAGRGAAERSTRSEQR